MRSRAGQGGQLLGRAVQRIRRRNVFDVVRSAFDEAVAQAGASIAATFPLAVQA